MTVIALADHDNVDGIAPALEAAKNFLRLKVIPCVEISSDVSQGEVHILGYFVDYTDGELVARLERMSNSRLERAQAMISKLRDLGIDIEWARVQEIAGKGSVGRPHLAQAMLEKGYITSLREAFTSYIGRGSPAYIERRKLTPAAAVELISRVKGLPVLAHPLTVGDPEALVIELKATGLVGIEAYYPDYNADEIRGLKSLAEKCHLVVTGGSDYHGVDTESEIVIGGVPVPLSAAEHLMSLAPSPPPS